MLQMIHEEYYPVLYEELQIWKKAKTAAAMKSLVDKITKAELKERKEQEEHTILEETT